MRVKKKRENNYPETRYSHAERNAPCRGKQDKNPFPLFLVSFPLGPPRSHRKNAVVSCVCVVCVCVYLSFV